MLVGALVVAVATTAACGTRLQSSAIASAAHTVTQAGGQPATALGPGGATVTGGTTATGAGTPGSPATGGPAGAVAGAGEAAAQNGQSPSATPASGSAIASGDAPIVIGSVGTQSGIVGASIADGVKALQAWVSATNARGGLEGHPVKLIVADDGGDPARHQALVQQLVESDHVIAFVYNDAPLTGQASVQYLTQKRVPVIGSELAGQWFYQSPMFFPQADSGLVLTDVSLRGVAQVTVPQGKTKVALMTCLEAQYCTDAAKIWPGLASQVGMKVVANSSVSLATPDFTSQCLNAQGGGAQVFVMAMDSNSVDRVAASCASLGYHPIFSWASSVTVDRHRTDPNLSGAVLPIPESPWFLPGNPAIQQFQSTVARYAPGLTAGGSSENGWVAAKLFEAAATHLSATPTSADILAGLAAIHTNTLGGLTEPLTFTSGRDAPPTECWFSARIGNGNWTTPDNGTMHCR
ncbi:MAG TPA: ABC transporter substrate-binding protein [Acidimicrobiales bacterium]|nr:ABC transporter substrate-binding protein [Acidimicrobiales bacterium]